MAVKSAVNLADWWAQSLETGLELQTVYCWVEIFVLKIEWVEWCAL